MSLYVENEVVDWVRVWKKGMVGGRERSSYGTPDERFASSGVDRRFIEGSVVVVEMDDFDERLCREVRLSSRGFMSGGMEVIFRKVRAR